MSGLIYCLFLSCLFSPLYKIRFSCACKHIFKISSLHILFCKNELYAMHHSEVIICLERETSFNPLSILYFDWLWFKKKMYIDHIMHSEGNACFHYVLCFGFQFWQFFQINFLSFLFLFYLSEAKHFSRFKIKSHDWQYKKVPLSS